MSFGTVVLAALTALLLVLFARSLRRAERERQTATRIGFHAVRSVAAIACVATLCWLSTFENAGTIPGTAFSQLFAALAILVLSAPLEGLVTGRMAVRGADVIRKNEPIWFWVFFAVAAVSGLATATLAVAGFARDSA